MFTRKVMLPVVLAAAAGAPFVYSKNMGQKAKEGFRSVVSYLTTDAAPDSHYPSEFSFGPRAEDPSLPLDAGFVGPPCGDFNEVFRADVSPDWVTQRWPRITTVTAESGLEGLRVPLMTGTKIDDLAGTLTYYFNAQHQVQRLAFDGFTGDDRRLLAALTQVYGLQSEPTLHAGMYVTRWNGQPTSVMRVSRAPVITTATAHAQYHLQLELNRPSHSYGLSPDFQKLIQLDRNANRW
jgi:hypothetical protein